MERLDGNAIGGVLLDLFGVEMTVAKSICGSCGAHAEIARLHVYTRGPGIVVRCAGCEGVVLRIVEGRDRTWVDLSGMRSLEIPKR